MQSEILYKLAQTLYGEMINDFFCIRSYNYDYLTPYR